MHDDYQCALAIHTLQNGLKICTQTFNINHCMLAGCAKMGKVTIRFSNIVTLTRGIVSFKAVCAKVAKKSSMWSS